MKRVMIGILALLLAWPALSHAQFDDQDRQDAMQYRDIEDGQLLKIVSYILTPVGMGLEWGLTRPLHYAATHTKAAPLLSGDTDPSFFGQNSNADHVPPGTFGPYVINPTNNIQPSNDSTVASAPVVPKGLAPAQSIPPSTSGGQPALQ